MKNPFNILKWTLVFVALIALLTCHTAKSQTNAPTSDPFGLGELGLSVEAGLQNSGLLNATNYGIAPYFTYAPKAKDKFGGGALAVFNVPAIGGTNGAVGAALGGDWLGHWSMVSGNVTLKLETHPFAIGVLSFLPQSVKDITAEPFAIAGVGSPLSGGSGAATIWDLGYNFKFGHLWGGRFDAGFAWGEWMNAGIESGHRYHVYAGWSFGF